MHSSLFHLSFLPRGCSKNKELLAGCVQWLQAAFFLHSSSELGLHTPECCILSFYEAHIWHALKLKSTIFVTYTMDAWLLLIQSINGGPTKGLVQLSIQFRRQKCWWICGRYLLSREHNLHIELLNSGVQHCLTFPCLPSISAAVPLESYWGWGRQWWLLQSQNS